MATEQDQPKQKGVLERIKNNYKNNLVLGQSHRPTDYLAPLKVYENTPPVSRRKFLRVLGLGGGAVIGGTGAVLAAENIGGANLSEKAHNLIENMTPDQLKEALMIAENGKKSLEDALSGAKDTIAGMEDKLVRTEEALGNAKEAAKSAVLGWAATVEDVTHASQVAADTAGNAAGKVKGRFGAAKDYVNRMNKLLDNQRNYREEFEYMTGFVDDKFIDFNLGAIKLPAEALRAIYTGKIPHTDTSVQRVISSIPGIGDDINKVIMQIIHFEFGILDGIGNQAKKGYHAVNRALGIIPAAIIDKSSEVISSPMTLFLGASEEMASGVETVAKVVGNVSTSATQSLAAFRERFGDTDNITPKPSKVNTSVRKVPVNLNPDSSIPVEVVQWRTK